MEVPADEDLLAFPPNPPNSTAETTKLAFKDKINFIIPKLKKKSDYTGKTCLKHHSILCKVCPLLKRAKLHRSKLLKRIHTASTTSNTLSSDNCVRDPISVCDPKISGSDPKNFVGDPFSPCNSTVNIKSSKINNTASDLLASVFHSKSINNTKGYTHCPSCAACGCPRGRYRSRQPKLPKNQCVKGSLVQKLSLQRQIPCLLDLPIVVPPKYCCPQTIIRFKHQF